MFQSLRYNESNEISTFKTGKRHSNTTFFNPQKRLFSTLTIINIWAFCAHFTFFNNHKLHFFSDLFGCSKYRNFLENALIISELRSVRFGYLRNMSYLCIENKKWYLLFLLFVEYSNMKNSQCRKFNNAEAVLKRRVIELPFILRGTSRPFNQAQNQNT